MTWENEVTAYSLMIDREKPQVKNVETPSIFDYFGRYFGSFTHCSDDNTRHIIILEYLEGGTLSDYVEKKSHSLTKSASSRRDFWRQMAYLLEGLDLLHEPRYKL